MSLSLSAAASTQFDAEVLQEYQGMGGLKNTVTVRSGVVGDTYKFRGMGRGLAHQRGATQTDVTPMNVVHSLTTATLENWVAPEYTDIFDDAEVNFQERRELAQTIAGGLGRREDQMIIDACDASTYAGTVDQDIGGVNSDLNADKVRRASRYLNDKGVPGGDRHIVHGASQLEMLLADSEATSADYVNVKALVNGDVNTYGGFHFHLIDDRSADEGGLKVATSIREVYAYHSSAVGIACGIDPRTEVNYIPQKTSWLATGLLKAGAIARNANGIVLISCEEAA